MAPKRIEWDFAFRIRGITRDSMPMGRLAEYIRVYAELLGDSNDPRFVGVVKGSALVRARVPVDRQLDTKIRLMSITGDVARADESSGRRAYATLAEMMATDGLSGDIEDRTGAIILKFERPRRVDAPKEYIVKDSGVLDGVLISLVGMDDTVHLRLQDVGGRTHKVTVRDIAMARRVATHFRDAPLRVHVHGTWKRTAEGKWEPYALYLDRFEELSDEPASAILSHLSGLPGNRWAAMEDPQAFLRDLRGSDGN
jgi:hypothetical protein